MFRMVCSDCAEKNHQIREWHISNLGGMPMEDHDVCQICGEKAWTKEIDYHVKVGKNLFRKRQFLNNKSSYKDFVKESFYGGATS
jgi:hypothetical protein